MQVRLARIRGLSSSSFSSSVVRASLTLNSNIIFVERGVDVMADGCRT